MTTNSRTKGRQSVSAKTEKTDRAASDGLVDQATEEVTDSTVALPKSIARQPSGPGEVLGDVAWLMTHSPAHKHLFIADLEWLVLPPVMRKQFRLFKNGERPFAYASWALLDEEGEKRLLAGNHRLRLADWHAGDRLWLIDLIAPFGGHEGVLASLKKTVFKDRKLMALKPNPDGQGVVVGEVTAEAKGVPS